MRTNLNIVALTGGIATGKSTCCRLIQRALPEAVIFDADACVKDLYTRNEVHLELKDFFGDDVILSNGLVDKSLLRDRAFSCSDSKVFLEQVFHPRVIKECLALLDETASKGASRLFVADIPLLFEGGIDFGQSANLLVATSSKTQINRLKNRNDWSDDIVDAVIQSQLSMGAKLALADVVFWNEGPEAMLQTQVERYIRALSDDFTL